MELKTVIEENAVALKSFKAKVDGLGGTIHDVKDRLKNLEQLGAGGHKSGSYTTPASSLAKQVSESESFKSLVEGHAKNAKATVKGGLSFKNTITGDAGSPAQPTDTLNPATRMAGIVGGPLRAPRIRDLIPLMPTSSNMIEVTRELTWTNDAAPQAGEGATKAESDITFELMEVPVRTIAHFIKASKQSLADQPVLGRLLDERMSHGVLMEEESQLLTGDGTGHNLDGLITNATAFSGAQTGDTLIDTLRRAVKQVKAADFEASGIVLNPAEWAEIELTKDADGNYVFGDPAEKRPPQMWGVPVVESNSMTAGSFLVGDFEQAAILWDRQAVVVEAFEEDSDNIQRNLVTIRAEERVALTVIRPAALVTGSF